MSRKTLLVMASVLALMPLSACESTALTTDKPVDISFAQMAPLQLNVGAVQVINNTQPTNNPRVSPAIAMQNYARQRLQAVGGEGTLNFIIQQASLTTREAESTGEWTEAFELSKPMEYTITMRVGLDLVDRVTQPNVKSAFTLERKKTMPAGASLSDRDRELNAAIVAMIADVDKAVERTLSDNMKLVVKPGPITFGKPAPLESQGAVVVQPGPASANPVTITGTME